MTAHDRSRTPCIESIDTNAISVAAMPPSLFLSLMWQNRSACFSPTNCGSISYYRVYLREHRCSIKFAATIIAAYCITLSSRSPISRARLDARVSRGNRLTHIRFFLRIIINPECTFNVSMSGSSDKAANRRREFCEERELPVVGVFTGTWNIFGETKYWRKRRGEEGNEVSKPRDHQKGKRDTRDQLSELCEFDQLSRRAVEYKLSLGSRDRGRYSRTQDARHASSSRAVRNRRRDRDVRSHRLRRFSRDTRDA